MNEIHNSAGPADINNISENINITRSITDKRHNKLLRVEAGIMIKNAENYRTAHHAPKDFGYIYSGFYVYDGRGVYIDCKTNTEIPFSKGDFVQRIPGVEHETNCVDENGWKEIYILFDGSFFDAFSNSGIMTVSPVIHLGKDNTIEKKILAQVNRLSRVSDNDVPYVLFEMQSLIYEINQIGQSNRKLPHVDAACEYIRQNCCNGISMKNTAYKVGVSYNRLRRDFRKVTGMSMSDYCQIERIKSAVYMMTVEKKPIKEVASLTGYANEFIFIRQFSKITGYPPGKYLKLHTQQISSISEKSAIL